MIRIADKTQLLNTFRSIDRDQVELPHELRYPLAVRDYASWIESSGQRAYLVFADPDSGQPVGVVFRRVSAGHDAPASMCHWCHAVRVGGAVGLLTATSSPRRTVGLHVCADLSCKVHVRAPGPHDLSENLSGTERVQRIVLRMSDFARRNLF